VKCKGVRNEGGEAAAAAARKREREGRDGEEEDGKGFEDIRRRARVYPGRREGTPAATARIVIVQFAKTKAHPQVSGVREAPLDISRRITQSA
jgi:hypothetical protein